MSDITDMSIDPIEFKLAQQLGEKLAAKSLCCAVAESCTGGRLAAAITEISGSSQWFDRGFITYSNQAKTDLLGVSDLLIQSEGAVSDAVVRAMAEGAFSASRADLTVAVSGIAGPTGGTTEKPVGFVWLAWSGRSAVSLTQSYCFEGDRFSVRTQAVCTALEGLLVYADGYHRGRF